MRKVMKSCGILKAEKSMYAAVVMQTTFWGGGGDWQSSLQILLALLASVRSKNKGGRAGSPGPFPGSATV